MMPRRAKGGHGTQAAVGSSGCRELFQIHGALSDCQLGEGSLISVAVTLDQNLEWRLVPVVAFELACARDSSGGVSGVWRHRRVVWSEVR